MHDFSTFFAMNGYAAYIWPAYGLTAAIFALLLGWTVHTLRAQRRLERDLAGLGKMRRSQGARV